MLEAGKQGGREGGREGGRRRRRSWHDSPRRPDRCGNGLRLLLVSVC